MQRLCVYCGSSPGAGDTYTAAARELGELMADSGIALVYGGASVGTMGVIADTVMQRGGHVTGVIPQMLSEKEIAHEGLSELHVVDSMHDRKMLMAALSDAFVALPGGVGTLEEIIEVTTWSLLGYHDKPCGLLNVDGYFDRLLGFLDHAVDQDFLRPAHRSLLQVSDSPTRMLALLRQHADPGIDR